MKILWLCNVVLPEFCSAFNIKRTNAGGWMSGMLSAMKVFLDVEIGLCFPIRDENKMKKSLYEGKKYYSFHADMAAYDYTAKMVQEFKQILLEFEPDVVHIWGTEYNHAGAMVEACNQLNISNRILIHIQGLVSVCARHYANGIPEEWLSVKTGGYSSIFENIKEFELRGQNERNIIQKIKYISGRTEWDHACVKQINPNIYYKNCEEIIRDYFYLYKKRWDVGLCKKNSIFISQASYPIKGFHFLLVALSIVQKIYPKVRVYVGGSQINKKDEMGNISPYGMYINHLIAKYKLTDVIEFLGVLDEKSMVEQYIKSHVFVSPSTIENSPNSICEAMYLGVPVVASYVGGVPSLIEHNNTGLLYPCDAEYMLADNICRIFSNDNLAMRFSGNSRKVAEVRQNKEKNAKINYKIYQDIIAEN